MPVIWACSHPYGLATNRGEVVIVWQGENGANLDPLVQVLSSDLGQDSEVKKTGTFTTDGLMLDGVVLVHVIFIGALGDSSRALPASRGPH